MQNPRRPRAALRPWIAKNSVKSRAKAVAACRTKSEVSRKTTNWPQWQAAKAGILRTATALRRRGKTKPSTAGFGAAHLAADAFVCEARPHTETDMFRKEPDVDQIVEEPISDSRSINCRMNDERQFAERRYSERVNSPVRNMDAQRQKVKSTHSKILSLKRHRM
jgi:hypothetical protein